MTKEIELQIKNIYSLMERGDFESSFIKLKELEKSDEALVLYMIGYMMYTGKGTALDQNNGVIYIIKAAEKGLDAAKRFLAELNKPKKSVPSSSEIDNVLNDAMNGDTKAKYKYAMMCMKGQVPGKGKLHATEFFTQAANEGHTLSMIALFNRYYIDKDFETMWSRAKYWFDLAYKNDKERLYIVHPEIIDADDLLKKSLETENPAEKEELINQAILKKHYGAYRHLADLKDGEEAIELYEKGASFGDAEAALKLCECYKKGINTQTNENNALFWENEYLRLKQYIGK